MTSARLFITISSLCLVTPACSGDSAGFVCANGGIDPGETAVDCGGLCGACRIAS
jgi:hypothetical protein